MSSDGENGHHPGVDLTVRNHLHCVLDMYMYIRVHVAVPITSNHHLFSIVICLLHKVIDEGSSCLGRAC